MNALFPNGFELSNELSNLKILVTVEPEAGFKHVHLSFKFVLITFLFLSAIYIYTVTIIENLFILAARICKKKKSPKLMRILRHLNMSTEFDHQKILDCMYCHSFSLDCSVIGQSLVSSIRR